jgi:hypothetical protein
MSSLSYFKLIQVEEPSFLVKEKPGFKGLLTSMVTKSLRKLQKVASTPLLSSTFTRWPRPFPIAMAFLIDMLCRGRP